MCSISICPFCRYLLTRNSTDLKSFKLYPCCSREYTACLNNMSTMHCWFGKTLGFSSGTTLLRSWDRFSSCSSKSGHWSEFSVAIFSFRQANSSKKSRMVKPFPESIRLLKIDAVPCRAWKYSSNPWHRWFSRISEQPQLHSLNFISFNRWPQLRKNSDLSMSSHRWLLTVWHCTLATWHQACKCFSGFSRFCVWNVNTTDRIVSNLYWKIFRRQTFKAW